MPPVRVRFEQAVYGSFAFWDRGYAVLARSPGVRDEWLADLRAACQRLGERPQGAADAGGLFALRLPSGPWAIVGPVPQGADDRGRPGALAFHALFVSGADYRRAGAFPFAFAPLLRSQWTAETTTLPSGSLLVDPPPADPVPAADPLAARIASALASGRKVAIEAPGPIDELARSVWLALPPRRRRRLSLATWTFSNGNRHDLAALPRLANVALDRSYVDPASLVAGAPVATLPPRPWPWVGLAAWLGLGAICLVALAYARFARTPRVESPDVSPVAVAPVTVVGRPLSGAEEARAVEGLFALAGRFDVLDGLPPSSLLRPGEIGLRLRGRLVYRDAVLTPSEVDSLARSSDPDRSRVLAWHAQILHFLPDHPLPADFADLPRDAQLRALAWSFHVATDGHRAEEIPRLLSEALSVPVPARPSPLAAVYPALGDYSRFLRGLPVR